MARKRKGPRLYLRNRSDGPSYWVIRDGGRMVGTGLLSEEREAAEVVLAEYCARYAQEPGASTIRPEPHPLHNRGVVYFATCDAPDFPIKIGWSADAKVRLSSIQVSMPYEVMLLACMPGSPDDERSLHISFRSDRIRGEWFRRSPELLEYLRRIFDVDAHLRRMAA